MVGSPNPVLDVVIGVLLDQAARVLIAQRPSGTHMAGCWEFPGGKRTAGEAPIDALRRELAEEIGVDLLSAEPLMVLDHAYPDRTVRLDVWQVTEFANAPVALEGQVLRWVDADELNQTRMLPADGPIVAAVCARLRYVSTARAEK